ncbi:MAG: pyridoxal-phosphate dependent enzyme [Lewinellaceae bacterium]|nr:pyridoxal-phosphate dependent enzyme [Saprospiraceae bacterium]MCB9336701.1 pyridoxal-phosphate dependent enzyme [Lewinellaceae bacterium]
MKKEDLLSAHRRIQPYIHRTPVLTCQTLDALSGATLFFKCENFQKMGAFKMRGAANAILQLSEGARQNGVATHSSGNFAQALSLAAKMLGVKAYIVMPSNSPEVKKAAVRDYGGEIIECEPTLQAREDTLQNVVNRTGATFIHPFNDDNVILGQGTAALELLEEIPDLDYIISPVGGGGLLGGTALAARFFSSGTIVTAAEPFGADDAWQSKQAGHIIPQTNPQTIADGLRTSLGDKTFPLVRDHVEAIIRVEEQEIVEALRLLMERMKIVVEPSGAVALAALLREKDKFSGQRIGIILSGGNVDLKTLGGLFS